MKLTGLFILVESSVIGAQSFLDGIAGFSQLSDFRDLLIANPGAASTLLTNIASGDQRTILVPSNNAFDNYRQTAGQSVSSSLSSTDLEDTINYHSLQGALSSADIQKQSGLVSNTALTNPSRDNRGLESDGAKKPQVVAIVPANTANGRRIMVRQAGGIDVKSGKGQGITLNPTPGNWSGGNFYIVDGFLTLPENQTDTMMAQGLTSFVKGLERTNSIDGTNAASNLTCLCPNNEAFTNISRSTGNLTSGLGSLLATLARHALPETYYTPNFTDGALIHSQNGYPILVTRRNGSIFLNDAKLVGTDFITRSGAAHALDRIIGFLNTTTNITTPATADIYRNWSNIPPPTSPLTVETYTEESTAMRWGSRHLYLMLGVFVVEAWRYLVLE